MEDPKFQPVQLPLAQLLPIRVMVVSLQFLESSRPRFFHQCAITAFVRHLLNSPPDYDKYLIVDTPESSRVLYKPGEPYRFSVIALAGGEALLAQLMQRLKLLPESAKVTDAPLAFRNNCRCLALHDGFSEQAVDTIEELKLYNLDSLQQEAEQWASHQRFSWHWLSPVRLLKNKRQREKLKGEARYCRNAGDVDADLLLSRLYDTAADLLRRRGEHCPPRPLPPSLSLVQQHVFWLDSEYSNREGEEQAMGGMLGHFAWQTSETFEASWWPLMVLGQYIGMGQRRSFGMGRFELVTADGGVTYRRSLPALPLLAKVLDESNLRLAYRHIEQNAAAPQHEQQSDDEQHADEERFSNEDIWPEEKGDNWEDEEYAVERLKKFGEKLQSGRYEIPELRGYRIEKPDGRYRDLAVPPFWDRVMQRAVAQVLGPSLEAMMDNRSHGYRPGRSRHTAKEAIQRAYREGYCWVFESDIADFFPSVNLWRVADRLRALFYDDPLLEHIFNWLAAPVTIQGKTLQRSGLPQGSPLSPLMANLLLDDFDNDMQSAGFRLIRYADDFVVMCKNPEDALRTAGRTAGRAAELAETSLAEHALQLKTDKSRIRQTEQGFKYLGYLFVNDMALDVGGQQVDIGIALNNTQWQHQLKEKPLKRVDHESELPLPQIKPSPNRQPLHIGEMGSPGTFLCITGNSAYLSTRNGRLLAERDEETVVDIPWQHLQAVLLAGPHHITTPALRAAMANKVPVHFATAQGYYQGVAWQAQPTAGHSLWLEQHNKAQDSEAALFIAKQLVKARLEQQAETLRLRGLTGNEAIKSRLDAVASCENFAQLNGVEGQAAKQYFAAIAKYLPANWGFNKRERRPPPDPFNVLLSLGYSMLYAYTESILHADGLLPWQGFYHKNHGRHAALASDLMEPFRHHVERVAISQLIKNSLRIEDFSTHANGACQMQAKAKRHYLAQLQQRFATATLSKGSQEKETLFQQIHRQNLSLIQWLRGEQAFEAWSRR